MKRRFTFSDGENIEASFGELKRISEEMESYIRNYEEMLEDLDSPEYIARGNGFCATQYSDTFIESQILKYKRRIDDLNGWLSSPAARKDELRKRIRQLKKAHTPEELAQQSAEVCERIMQHPEFMAANRIMLYCALPDEVNTDSLIERYRNEKHLILPTVVGDDIIPVAMDGKTRFSIGDFSIREPQGKPYTGEVDLIILPGMAFDRSGNRLGRGKGYYDRFLQHHPKAHRIGICFDFQLLDAIPTESNDMKVDEVVTIKR